MPVVYRKKSINGSAAGFCLHLLILLVLSAQARGDTITYQQVRQDRASAKPDQGAAGDRKPGSGNGAQSQQPQAQESPSHPEFVRLPDGRIVRYGPGVICDENCLEPETPAELRISSNGPGFWWIVTPVAAGGILCAILCGGETATAQTTPTIMIPETPAMSPTPPPAEIPEPSTILLLGLGLAALAVKREKRNKRK